jgi:hydroxyethylthiazole kinase-like uncharacterized protein yjeF
MKVLSPERMAKYDAYAIKTWGIPSAVLMENAGRSTYRLMKERYLKEGTRILIICGRGNNGGDGFVVGRYAKRDGFAVKVILLGGTSDLKGDAALNMGLYRSIGGEILEGGLDPATVRREVGHAGLIVDAIFGTGLSKAVEGLEKAVIEEINKSSKRIISIDIPSGIDGNTGLSLGAAVEASHTFTYGYPKIGQCLYPGAYHTGRLTVIDISIPGMAEESLGVDAEVIDGDMVRKMVSPRIPWAHKGTYGHAVVVAGSPGKTGAAHMASLAALKVGAGLVTLMTPSSLNAVLEAKTTEVMTYPVEDRGTGCFLLSAYDDIVEFLGDKDVLIIGPGLSQNPETMELVRRLYVSVEKPLVIDADGINAFRDHADLLRQRKGDVVLTPHPGELGRLTGISPGEVNRDRINAGKGFVAKQGVNLLLKGARSILFTVDGRMLINPTGSAALAKGGSGDILTGFIGGFVSQGHSVVESSALGAYLHGYIAEDWVEENTDMDLLACDLLNGLAGAIRDLRDGTERVYIEKSL